MVSVVEGALHHLGQPGGYHVLVAVLLCCNYFPITFHHLTTLFYTTDIAHTCRLPEAWPWHKKFSIPTVTPTMATTTTTGTNGGIGGGSPKYDDCRMFKDPNSAKMGTKSCVYGWQFYPQDREWTISAEWSLVCERSYLVSLATVVYSGGVMFGGLVFGTLADKFGRKPLMLFTLYVQTAISVCIYFVQNFVLYVILRFVHGLVLQGLQCTTLCLVVELLSSRYRTAAGIGCSIVWAMATICLSLIAYSVQHWRYIQLAISLPCVVTLLYVWLIPESVRWLVTMTKTENAISAARKFSVYNKTPLTEEFSRDVESAVRDISSKESSRMVSYGFRELVCYGSQLRIGSLVLCFCWFSASSLYQALSQRLFEVASDRYTSIVVVGFVDLIAFVVMYFVSVRFGRRRPLCALLIFSGAMCISTVVAENLERGNSVEVRVVSTLLSLIERSCIAACLAGLSICAAEIFPTVVRAFGIGVCLFCGQVGWIAAPHILKLGHFTVKALPWIIFGTMTLIAGFLVLLLPETCNKPLPDVLEDMDNFENRKTTSKSEDVLKERSSTSDPNGNDTTKDSSVPPPRDYRAYIEAIVDGEDGIKEGAEKRWYNANYARRSARVVRFYGLDGSHEDPCQEVKTNKKQSIRMVRFSFENEEFRMDPRLPMQVRRFSVITEEPELETAVDDEDVGNKKTETSNRETDDNKPVVKSERSRFIVQRVDDDGETLQTESSREKEKSRFVVRRVEEENNVCDSGVVVQKSRFSVRRVTEEENAPPKGGKGGGGGKTKEKSRFVVQRVTDDTLDVINCNNNNNNNNNNNLNENNNNNNNYNNEEKFISDKKLGYDKECENVQNLVNKEDNGVGDNNNSSCSVLSKATNHVEIVLGS